MHIVVSVAEMMGLRPALVRAALALLVIMACREARCAATPDAVGKGHVAVEEMLRARLFTEPHKAQQRFALPKGADGGPVDVAVGVYFYSLGQLDELAGTVAMSLWQRISWKDPNLVWNASAYGERSAGCSLLYSTPAGVLNTDIEHLRPVQLAFAR
jgi:hypothetical protein